jgi:hypothetical protein
VGDSNIMAAGKCSVCGGPTDAGFVSTSNGSGLFWAHSAESNRFRPKGLEVLVPTQFGVMSSSNLPGQRCPHCQTILVQLKPQK